MLLIAVLIVFLVKNSSTIDVEEDLFENLLNEDAYKPHVRPVEHPLDILNVSLDLHLYQLINIDEKEERMDISIWMNQRWRDYRLAWNPDDYDGLRDINVHPDMIWKPDIVLYNNVIEGGGHMDEESTQVHVYNNGDINWSFQIILSTRCEIDITYFPYDTQDCYLLFGSWTHNLKKMNVSGTEIDVKYYHRNHEWNLKSVETEYAEDEYGTGTYAEVYFHLYFQRRSLYYVFNLIIPMVLITLLTTLAFVLPEEAGERMGVAVTLMLAATVFMLLVAESIPESSDSIPYVGIFFVVCFVLMFLMIIALCFVSRIYNRTRVDRPMGRWTRKYVLDKLSYFLGVRHKEKQNKVSMHDDAEKEVPVAIDCNGIDNVDGDFPSDDVNVYETPIEMKSIEDGNEADVDQHMRRRKKKKKKKRRQPKPDDADAEGDGTGPLRCEEEWYIIGKTLDRIFFSLFFMAFIIGCAACFAGTKYVG